MAGRDRIVRESPVRSIFCFLTPFRHLSKRPFIHTGGDQGKAECGASAEGWRERPALALFRFSLETRSQRRGYFNDSGPTSAPQPPRWPVSKPCASGAFVFSAKGGLTSST